MKPTHSNSFRPQGGSRTGTDRPFVQAFPDFDLNRSRDCRRRHRVISSAQKVAALFHHDIEDRQRLH